MGEPLTATLGDPDGTALPAHTWSWSWNTTSTGSFTTITGANSATYTPATTDAGRYLKAAVSYTDHFGSGQSAEQVSGNAVATNPPPEFADNSVTLSVNENTTSGTVGRVTATDPDGDAITYSVGGTDQSAFKEDFSLDSSNGEITVKPDATIDHETKPSYSVTITATDPYEGTDEIDVTITVTNVDEPGVVTLSRTTPTVGKSLTATLSDPDGGVTAADLELVFISHPRRQLHHRQRSQQRHLHTGSARCGPVPETGRHLHRLIRPGQERREDLGQRSGGQPATGVPQPLRYLHSQRKLDLRHRRQGQGQ